MAHGNLPRAPLPVRDPKCRLCYTLLTEENRFELEGVPACIACKPRLVQMVQEGVPLDELAMGPEEIDHLVQKNLPYYHRVFAEMRGRKWSWNWLAFFFPIPWLFYRKMYLFGLVFMIGAAVFEAAIEFATSSAPASRGSQMLYRMILGVFGNLLYRRHLQGVLAKVNSLQLPSDERLAALKKRGGVSTWACVAVIVVPAILHILAATLSQNVELE